MKSSTYDLWLLAQVRIADNMRDAEHQRLIRSVKKQSDSPGWLERLGRGLSRLRPVHPDARPGQPASRPTV